VLAAVGVATLVAACGDGGEPTTNSGDGQGAFAAYQACLAQHGVTLPSRGQRGLPRPSGDRSPGGLSEGGGVPPSPADRGGGFLPGQLGTADPKVAAAAKACAALRPTGRPNGANGAGGDGVASTDSGC
jgi:hypothetical protein